MRARDALQKIIVERARLEEVLSNDAEHPVHVSIRIDDDLKSCNDLYQAALDLGWSRGEQGTPPKQLRWATTFYNSPHSSITVWMGVRNA